jgi:hypothetical protein
LPKRGLESGLVTENDLEEMATAWEKWAEGEDFDHDSWRDPHSEIVMAAKSQKRQEVCGAVRI